MTTDQTAPDSLTLTVPRHLARLAAVAAIMIVGVLTGMAVEAATVGASVEDSTYTAVAPCAAFDTRTDTGPLEGKYGHLEARAYQITGAATTDQQEGIDCGIPAGADAVMINLITSHATATGNLRAFATGQPSGEALLTYTDFADPADALNTTNAVIVPLSAAGQLTVQNNCHGCGEGSVHVRGIVLGYFTDDLAARVEALEALLADVTRDDGGPNGTDRLLFTGMNLQIVDGSGQTTCDWDGWGFVAPCDGSGNLIIGYNEATGPRQRTGAHSLIVGDDHEWTASATVVFGGSNTASSHGATVTGGSSNEAGAQFSSVSGGSNNSTTDWYSTVTGGFGNTANEYNATVSGGSNNEANARYSAVGGGQDRMVVSEGHWRAGSLLELN